MEWTERVVGAFAKGLNVLSAVWLGSNALLILCDVIGREAFHAPFPGTNEIVSNSVLAILLLQLPLSILTRSSLRTTILYDWAIGEQEGSGILQIPVYPVRTLVVLVSVVGVAVCALLIARALGRPRDFVGPGASDGA